MSGFGRVDGDGQRHDLDGADDVPAEEKLAFDRDGESLPWLESEEDYEEEQGVDTRRILGFALAGVALLGVLVGLMWWLTNRGPDTELVADGSTIPAPEEPYKVKPSDPGGKTYAGTGDESFAVGEGKTPRGQIAQVPAPAPGPSIAIEKDAGAPEAVLNGVGVQVGAYSSRETAEAGWNRLVTTHEVLKGYKHRVVEGTADIGTVYRLQAVVGDEAGANQLCATLRSQGAACQVKR